MGQVIAFSTTRRLNTGGDHFESIGAAANKVVEGLRVQLRLADILITIPVPPDILENIDHDALWSGLDRTELLRRSVTAAYTR